MIGGVRKPRRVRKLKPTAFQVVVGLVFLAWFALFRLRHSPPWILLALASVAAFAALVALGVAAWRKPTKK